MSRSQAERDAAAFRSWFYRLSRFLLLVWAKVWLRLSRRGMENAPPDGPLLIVANHCSYLDPPLLGIAVTRPVRFLARNTLSKFRPLGWWMRTVGVCLVDRDAPSKDTFRVLCDVLAQGQCVGLFPEGTRSPDGRVHAFRAGIEFLVRRSGAAVLPVGIDGSFRSFPKGGWLPRPVRCRVRVGTVWTKEQVLAPGGVEALRAVVAELAGAELAPVEPQVDQGRKPLPTDPSHSAGGRA